MENPFESGYVKNYILFYVGAVAIAVLFFVATNLFHESAVLPKKEFKAAEVVKKEQVDESDMPKEHKPIVEGLKMMEKRY
jgi:hypothetical protein